MLQIVLQKCNDEIDDRYFKVICVFFFRSAKGEKQRRKIRVFALRVLDLLEVCWTNDCVATAAEKPPWVGSGGPTRLSPLSLLHFLAFPLSRSEDCRTNKVYGLQSTPGESVESTIISNFSTFISRFSFLDETRDARKVLHQAILFVSKRILR